MKLKIWFTGGVKVYPSNRTITRDEIIFEVEVTWASECNLEVVVRQTHDFVCLGVKVLLFGDHHFSALTTTKY